MAADAAQLWVLNWASDQELVRIARSELGAHLRGRGALVGSLEWDPAKGKGIGDHLASIGPHVVLEAIEIIG